MSETKCPLCGMETKYHGETCTAGGSFAPAPDSDSQGWEIWPMVRAVTTPNIVRLRREEALHWLRHGDSELRDRAERTIESLRHHPNAPAQRPPATDV